MLLPKKANQMDKTVEMNGRRGLSRGLYGFFEVLP